MNENTARALCLLAAAFLAGMALEQFIQQQRRREEYREGEVRHLGEHVAELLADKYERENPPAAPKPATA